MINHSTRVFKWLPTVKSDRFSQFHLNIPKRQLKHIFMSHKTEVLMIIMFPKRSLGTYCFYSVSSYYYYSLFYTFFSKLFCTRVFSKNYSIYEVKTFLVWIEILCRCAEPISFLAHLSWKLKWAYLITCHPSSVCLSVCLSVCPSVNFSHFHLLLQNHWANFNQTWHKVSLGEGDSSLFKWRATPFPKGR